MLEVAIQHDYPGFALDVRFEAGPGVTAIFGKSGSGKTTILNAIAGLMRPRSGRITFDNRVLFDAQSGAHLPPYRRAIGYVFQDGRLFPHMTVRGNLEYGARMRRHAVGSDDRRHIVDLLGIDPLMERRPQALSGGEKQRVAIGRALLAGPKLLVLDEPLAALDEARKREILPYLERIRDEARIPILYVSHSPGEVARLANAMVLIDQGKVIAQGKPADLLSNVDLAPQLGWRDASSILTGKLMRHCDDGLSEIICEEQTLVVPTILAPLQSNLRLRLDAKDVIVATRKPVGISARNILKGQIVSLQPGQGPGMLAAIAVGKQRVVARITKRSAVQLGLKSGMEVYAIAKAVSVAQVDVGMSGFSAPDQ